MISKTLLVGIQLCFLTMALGCSSSKTSQTTSDSASFADVDAAIDSTGSDATPTADANGAADSAETASSLPSYIDVADTASIETADPQRVTVMTFNLMCSFCMNSTHLEWDQDWALRKPMIRDIFLRHSPDLIGIQELQEFVPYPPADLPDNPTMDQPLQITAPEFAYDFEFYHHKAGDLLDSDYDDATVFWKKARFDKLESGVFWLSPTPELAFSTGFKQPQEPRLVVWVLLHDKTTSKDFYFANTHYDNNAPSQALSAPLTLQQFAPLLAKHPLIFAGDFNANSKHVAYATLTQGDKGQGPSLQDSHNLAKQKAILTNVTPAPLTLDTLEDIDHIFLGGATFDVTWWVTDTWRYTAKVEGPTDHNGPIITSVHWQ